MNARNSGYLAWLHHVPSDTEKRREAVKAKIQVVLCQERCMQEGGSWGWFEF